VTGVLLLAVDQEQLPEDIGKAGPLGLLLIVVLMIAVVLLVRSMSRHLKRVPRSFDPADQVPDTPAELIDPPRRDPGEELLDTLRRAPRAIEAPRDRRRGQDDGRPHRS
jgi:hypothetical protein